MKDERGHTKPKECDTVLEIGLITSHKCFLLRAWAGIFTKALYSIFFYHLGRIVALAGVLCCELAVELCGKRKSCCIIQVFLY